MMIKGFWVVRTYLTKKEMDNIGLDKNKKKNMMPNH